MDLCLQTRAQKFFIPTQIHDNRSPLIFFEGNTIEFSERLYDTGGVAALLDFIARQGNGPYKDMNVLVRGHAAFVSNGVEARQREQEQLLGLSQSRALQVVDELVRRDIDRTRIFYEALGGSEEVSPFPSQRWKNRRVEVVFILEDKMQPIHEKLEPDTEDPSNTSNEVISDSPNIISDADVGDVPLENGEDGIISMPDGTQTIDGNQIIDGNTPGTAGEAEESRYIEPWPDTAILGEGKLTANEMLAFLLYNSPSLNVEYVNRIATYYVLEARKEKVNHDVAFAQMMLETNYLLFTGTVKKAQYNFAGIGTVDSNTEGNWFITEKIGVRAHIQHLKGYASTLPLVGDLVDPRYAILERYGLLGTAPVVSTLSGRWASDPEYGRKILQMMRRMYNFSNALNSISR